MFAGYSLIVILIVGLIAGWIAGKVVRGTGFGIIGDIIVGVLGAFVGRWLFTTLHIALIGHFWVDAIVQAAVGAIVLLIILRLIRR
jgi:uncharacterized membrane protein YeaQ/YmgE (transglycosylase-associated protein family)